MMSEGNPAPAIDFGELVHSEKFTAAVLKLNKNLHETRNLLERAAKCDIEKLSVRDQVVLDLYMAYSINSLYWMYLRTKGINPTSHPIKSEITRVRECVSRARQVHNRKKPSLRIVKGAVNRFVRSGLWQPQNKAVADVSKKLQASSVGEIQASFSSNQVDKKGGAHDQKNKPLGPPCFKKGKKTIFPD